MQWFLGIQNKILNLWNYEIYCLALLNYKYIFVVIVLHIFIYFCRSIRCRQKKDRATSEDSAGPSHSTAEESETWSAEEDGDEVLIQLKLL